MSNNFNLGEKIFLPIPGQYSLIRAEKNKPSKYDGIRDDWFFKTELGEMICYGTTKKNQAVLQLFEDALTGKNSNVFEGGSYSVSANGKLYIEVSNYIKVK